MPTRSVELPRSVPHEEPEPVALELAGVFLALLGLLLGSAIVTLAPDGATRGLANVTGSVGRAVAEALTLALGAGAYVLAVFPVAWGVACLRGRAPANWARKAMLVPLLAVLTAILAALLVRVLPVPGLGRSGPGGYLGVALGEVLFRFVGRAASLLVAGLLVATIILATDLRIAVLFGATAAGRARARRVATKGASAVAEADEDDLHPTEGRAADDVLDGAAVVIDEDEMDLAHASDGDVDTAMRGATADEEDAGTDGPRVPRADRPAKVKRTAPPKRRGDWEFPPTSLLSRGEVTEHEKVKGEIERNAAVLASTLRSFGIESRVVAQRRGPVITFYELELESGTRIASVSSLDRDLAVALKAENVRVVAPIPGKNTIGVEVPNTVRDPVHMLDLMEEGGEKAARRAMPLFLGRDALGEPIVEDLAGMPHMLIAGATGSGKSVCVNSVLLSVMMTRTPDEVKFILVDPKQVELSFFEDIPHLLTPVVTNMKKAAQIFEWAVAKMEHRYDVFLKAKVRNIATYNALGGERISKLREEHGFDEADAPELMPYIVIVVDELADLMMQHGKDVETAIIRLAAKSRAVGIHLILATQRPSVDVITGLIKSNMPMRAAFKVASKIDSRVILDQNGAEKLLGRGDMLYVPPGASVLKRAQGTFIPDPEVKAVVDFVKSKAGGVEYQDILGEHEAAQGDPNEEDDLYDDAVRAVLATKLGSASMLQRKFGIGYTRASRLIDMMCDHRIVGPHKGSKARELLVTLEEWESALATKKGQPQAPSALMAAAEEEGGELGPSDEADGIASKGSSKDASAAVSPWD
jgi:S-DNA-T family DNA segregation ATPase FtsK/SpoIIIE